MTPQVPAGARDVAGPPLLVALDLGSGTTAAALIGRVGGRRRLLAAAATPGGDDPDALVAELVARVRSAEPDLAVAAGIGADWAAAGHSRLVARTGPAPRMAIIAASEATRERLEAIAGAAGWLTTGASAARMEPLAMVRLATRPGIAAILLGSADPPDADERSLIDELLAVAGAVASRRSGIPVVLAGGFARSATGPAATAIAGSAAWDVVLAPGPASGQPPGSDLRGVLVDFRAAPDDGRRALTRSAASLARVLGQRIELIDIGVSGATRVSAVPDPFAEGGIRLDDVDAPAGALLALDDPATFDRVETWSTLTLDRARLRDRLAELHLAPWSDLAADGAPLRAAALRAALERLLAAGEPSTGSAPDLVVATGAFGALPGPAVALVLADVLRRPGATQLSLDAARLLAPLGTIRDDAARDALIAELVEDLLVPLGTMVHARGARPGKPAGRVIIDAEGTAAEIDLEAGALALVDLPPGQQALADLQFRSTVDLGAPGRHFVVPVAGGLAGLLVDLRDLPDSLPDRPDQRRELLAGWEAALWPERFG